MTYAVQLEESYVHRPQGKKIKFRNAKFMVPRVQYPWNDKDTSQKHRHKFYIFHEKELQNNFNYESNAFQRTK